MAVWLRAPRPEAVPGIWRHNHQEQPEKEEARTPARHLVAGAIASGLCAWVLCAMLWNGFLGKYWLWPVLAIVPEGSRSGWVFLIASWTWMVGILGGICVFFFRLGRWAEVLRRIGRRLQQQPQGAKAPPRGLPEPPWESDPAAWPQVRVGGAVQAADRLQEAVVSGAASDVDYARITRAWEAACAQGRTDAFVRAVVSDGAAACPHGSGKRDISARSAAHDLMVRQVRIGRADGGDKVPRIYRGAGMALEPSLLGTSALVVGPPGSGKTSRLVRPVVESLCLQALAGQAAVVYLASGPHHRLPDEVFDLVVRVGDPASVYGLDLYGGLDDPDEAASLLAEALVGDLTASAPGGDSHRTAILLAQIVGPHQAVHGRLPGVGELRELLEDEAAVVQLRADLTAKGGRGGRWVREVDSYLRQSRAGADSALSSRVALLDRPVFDGFFSTAGAPPVKKPFSVRALDRPVRVRIDLPERGHPDASRVLSRLVLAQFTAAAADRPDQSLFAGLVLDDAAQTVTPQALRGIQGLRSAHGGVLLTMRALDGVPEHLRGPLLGSVGCRVACAGISPWDAERFTTVWGTEWIETRTVTNRELVSDEPVTKALHGLRRLVTGRYVSAESVTVRQEQRQRWSPSELADLPAGSAVVSMTTVRGDRTPPILTRLGGEGAM